MHSRITQINDLIRDIVSELFVQELSLKAGVFITLTRVDTTRNLRYTRVFVSVFPVEERGYAMKTLEHEKRNLERNLHARLATRPLPALDFVLDTTEEAADEVEKLLRSVKEEL